MPMSTIASVFLFPLLLFEGAGRGGAGRVHTVVLFPLSPPPSAIGNVVSVCGGGELVCFLRAVDIHSKVYIYRRKEANRVFWSLNHDG